ncbi:MAG TPA: hypothetical protein VIJ14_07190, partial [Rhabdochlamydiaceae bacterium]
EVCEAFSMMSKLVYTQEWETIGKALSPEIHQLITDWDTLSPREQGERAGYAFGKHGADILLPGMIAKTVSRTAAGGQEVVAAYRTLQAAEQTFALEAIARSGASGQELAEMMAKLAKGERSAIATSELSAIGNAEGVVSREIDHLGHLNRRVAEGWVLPKEGGGALINGRWYSEHALERMAPNTPEVMAILEDRALERAKALGLKPTTQEFGKWMERNGADPRGIPPSLVEAEIAQPGSTQLKVILNEKGEVVTVMPGGK